jgi:NAD(P)-dependent dehydrogenase (short-subunit alcohol dehydrogenase family)
MMAGRLEGLVGLVTGGGGGLGRAVALEMAREGAKLVVNDLGTAASGAGRDSQRAQAVVDQIVADGGAAVADAGDVAEWDDAEAMVTKALVEWGKLDILVNAAGILRMGTPFDTSPEDFDVILRVNLRGVFNTTRHAAAHWAQRREYGRLINFASGASIISQPTLLAYSTSKTGIIGLTRSCANALAAYKVTANCIRPSASTRMMDFTSPTAWKVLEQTGREQSELAAGTGLDPAHAAPLIVFLASPAAGHVSGRLFEGRAGRYVLWSEPEQERVLEEDFLKDPEAVYAGLEHSLCAPLSLRDLKMPMPPLDELGDWKATYGTRVPTWSFGEPAVQK